MAEKSYEQVMESINNRNAVYINDVIYAICNKYGVEDLKDWVQMDNMIDFLRDTDPELAPLLTKWLNIKPQHIPQEYNEWLKMLDYKNNPNALPYVRNLIIRVHIQNFIHGDIEDIEEDTTIEEVS